MTPAFLLSLVTLITGLISVAAFLWAVKSGQFKDIEAPKYQMMLDDDDDDYDDYDD